MDSHGSIKEWNGLKEIEAGGWLVVRMDGAEVFEGLGGWAERHPRPCGTGLVEESEWGGSEGEAGHWSSGVGTWTGTGGWTRVGGI